MSLASLRDVERELLRETGRRVVRFGFSPRPRGQTFLRPMAGGHVAVHLAFIKHAGDFDTTVDVAIRFDAVEELVNGFNTLLSKQEKSATCTLGAELGNLEDGRPYRLTITGLQDVETAVSRIADILERVGLPYIDRFSRLEAAYEVLSRDDRDVWIHCPIHAERAKRACASLQVLNRASEIHGLVERKMAFLESLKDPGVVAFSKFVAQSAK